MKKKRKRIFITGGSGFVGRNLAEFLSDRYLIFAPKHADLDLLDTDATRRYIKEKEIQVIVHCANVGGGRDTVRMGKVAEQNIRMFFNLERCLDKPKRMIFLGSGAEYDVRHYKPKMKEDYFDAHVPDDEYGFSKYVCSKHILAARKNIAGLRLFGVFGKYERYDIRFISNAIVRNILKMPIKISRNVKFNYLYIDDLVKIIERFINNSVQGKVINVTPGKPTDLLTIARKINDLGENKSRVVVQNKGWGKEYSADTRMFSKLYPGFEFTPIDRALKDLYYWYKNNMSLVNKKFLRKAEAYLKHTRTGAKA